MAKRIPYRLQSLLRPVVRTVRKLSNSSVSAMEHAEDALYEETLSEPPTESTQTILSVVDQQTQSFFLQKVPIEIRKIIYSFLWRNTTQGYHIYMENGHLHHARCVMDDRDEDPDFIQTSMDLVRQSLTYGATDEAEMRMWYRRLVSPWGTRHWRCEERILYGRNSFCDKTYFADLMTVCKRMHPEIVESIFESHPFSINDVATAHKFFVRQPSPFACHLRRLDLTLSTTFAEYASFIKDDADLERNRLFEVEKALSSISCLHRLYIAFDIWDRQCWRKVPETGLARELSKVNVREKIVLELPSKLEIEISGCNMATLEEPAFEIRRRTPLRYWEFCPGEIERFEWRTDEKAGGTSWVFAESYTYVTNPWA